MKFRSIYSSSLPPPPASTEFITGSRHWGILRAIEIVRATPSPCAPRVGTIDKYFSLLLLLLESLFTPLERALFQSLFRLNFRARALENRSIQARARDLYNETRRIYYMCVCRRGRLSGGGGGTLLNGMTLCRAWLRRDVLRFNFRFVIAPGLAVCGCDEDAAAEDAPSPFSFLRPAFSGNIFLFFFFFFSFGESTRVWRYPRICNFGPCWEPRFY